MFPFYSTLKHQKTLGIGIYKGVCSGYKMEFFGQKCVNDFVNFGFIDLIRWLSSLCL